MCFCGYYHTRKIISIIMSCEEMIDKKREMLEESDTTTLAYIIQFLQELNQEPRPCVKNSSLF